MPQLWTYAGRVSAWLTVSGMRRTILPINHQGYFHTQRIPSFTITWIPSIRPPSRGSMSVPLAPPLHALHPKRIKRTLPDTTSQRFAITIHWVNDDLFCMCMWVNSSHSIDGISIRRKAMRIRPCPPSETSPLQGHPVDSTTPTSHPKHCETYAGILKPTRN